MKTKQHSFSFRFLVLFFSFVFASLCLVSSGTIESQDGWLYLSVARNIYYKHEVIANPQTDYPDHNVNMNAMKGPDGKWRAPGSTGYSLAMVPAVALSDLILRHYGANPPHYFPLESDWTVLFFASFSNAFVTAILAIGLLLYMKELGFTRRQAVCAALLTIFATYFLPISKDAFAHPLYTASLIFCFYFIKLWGRTHRLAYLILLAISAYILSISYNEAYLLALFPLLVYFILGLPKEKRLAFCICIGVVGLLAVIIKPFLLVFARVDLEPIPKVVWEGVYGLLFSPGKGFFFYTPIFLLLPFFWWKIPKRLYHEWCAFGLLTLFFVYLYGKVFIYGSTGILTPIWYGGQDWGPRYIAPLVPFWMILTASIIFSLKKWQNYFITVPLVIISLCVQLSAVGVPYLMQYRDLQSVVSINKTEFSYYEYASFIPRYTPLFTMGGQFIRDALDLKSTITHGVYNVRLFDGFDLPTRTGIGFIRGFRQMGVMSFDQKQTQAVTTVSLRLENRSLEKEATESAHLTLHLDSSIVEDMMLPANRNLSIDIPIHSLSVGTHTLLFDVRYEHDSAKSHIVFIQQMLINGTNINLGSIDYPDVSTLGYKTTPRPYIYYGGIDRDTWDLWYMRAQIYEQTFDFWWIKNLYYWDRPQELLWVLFAVDITVAMMSGVYVLWAYRRM